MTTAVIDPSVERAREVAASVTDPEMPMLTLVDLGVLRSVDRDTDGRVVVAITPTYSGCPAMATMRADLECALATAGFTDVVVHAVLTPPWSTDWITDAGRRKLAEHGIAAPGTARVL
ncbi:MAG: phenylacetate-CoA oxygenase subunit PaaJ, partial [Mycobacterium sp.]|nr:phenylacetate-CoA oxygenase subunit PaaJ [Mycobacterium sp.]